MAPSARYARFPGNNLTGIFVDEVDEVAGGSFYSALADRVHDAHKGRVMFNPGAQLNCAIAGLSDIYVRYEVGQHVHRASPCRRLRSLCP